MWYIVGKKREKLWGDEVDYITAWQKSTGWIAKWYNKWQPKQIEYDDYYQECALYFWGKLKLKYEPEMCWGYSKIAYERIMIKLLYRAKNCRMKVVYINNEDFVDAEPNRFGCWSVNLKPHLQEVANLVSQGYETDEIVKITGKTKQTIYTYIKDIKRIYADKFGIYNYQRKHLRHFTRKRTEKELECWGKSRDRLKAVQELRKREKYLRTHEKLKQCVI